MSVRVAKGTITSDVTMVLGGPDRCAWDAAGKEI